MSIKQKLIKSGLDNMIQEIKNKYLLRMESYSFLMIIDKETGRYFNIYAKEFSSPDDLKVIANVLEKHNAIKEAYQWIK